MPNSLNNGGRIGPRSQADVLSASGIWSLEKQKLLKESKEWPVPPQTVNASWFQSTWGATMGPMSLYILTPSGEIVGNAIYSRGAVDSGNNNWYQQSSAQGLAPGAFRLAWHYVSGTSFTGDYGMDNITINGTTYGFESGADDFVTSTANTASSVDALNSAATLLTTTGASLGRWNRHNGSAPSSNTGPSSAYSGSFYVYAETSSPNYSNVNMWLFSPLIGE